MLISGLRSIFYITIAVEVCLVDTSLMNMLVQGGQGVHRSSTVSTVDMTPIEWDLDHQICIPNLAQSFVAVHRLP
jgi:uncharacterized membrane protein YGL010W